MKMKISLHAKLTALTALAAVLILAAGYFFKDFRAVLFVSGIVVLAAGFLLSRLVSRRITIIAKAARAMARGQYHCLYMRTGDEIEDLADAVNEVSSQIKARIQEINTNESRLEATFLSMFDGVMILDPQGNILLMNQTLTKLLQITEPVIGRKPIEVIRDQEIQDLADAVLHSEQGLKFKEIQILHPQERIFMIHATAIARDGKPDGAVLVFHDITELRKLEQVRKDFVANVSHELRTPMTNIKGYSETLLEGALDDPKVAREFAQIIQDDADRPTQLIDDLLSLAKIESGKIVFEKRLYDLKAVVDAVVRDLTPQARKFKVTVQNTIPSPVYASVDHPTMTQVFFNLVDNAIKYNREDGQVTISAREDNGKVIVSIADTGMGIPAEDMSRIFERFYRVDKARSRKLGGTGLGLSIVKHILQLHGADIAVQSEPGRGSTFQVTLLK